MKRILCRLLVWLLVLPCAAFAADDVVMKAMRDELSRSVAQLRLADLDKPYFIAYRVDENATTKISATLGQLTDKNLYRGRNLSVQVRVGSLALDNTNFLALRSEGFGGGSCSCNSTLPLDDDYQQIRRQIWLATDAEYKEAASTLGAKRSVLEHRQGGQQLADFTSQAPVTAISKAVELKGDVANLESLARELSATFNGSPEILTSAVDVYVINNYVRFINSEGTSFARANPIVVLDVRASTQAADGQPLSDAFRVYESTPDALSTDDLLTRTRSLISRVKALRLASSLERYTGPVLFEPEASAELMAQVFAPAIVAWRMPTSDEPEFEARFQQVLSQFGASLGDRLGGKVLPQGFDVIDDPRASRSGKAALMGFYEVDDEGTPSREVKIVENGILKNLLAGRTPTAQTKTSTGSMRGISAAPSNLFLNARKTSNPSDLRKELLRLAQQRGSDYGIVIRYVSPGSLSALMRMSFRGNVSGGSAVYKVFADGHEELVRADIAPITVNQFKDILAAGDKPAVYHIAFVPFGAAMMARASGGGSERDFVVSSYTVPSLLFEEISLKRPEAAAPKPPILASPMAKLNNPK